MQSCLVGVMGNGMMGLLTDRIMQTINEKQLVASENAQDRFNAMQSELIIAYHKVIRPCWSVTIKSKLFDVNRMYEIYIKTIPIVLLLQPQRPLQQRRQQQLQPRQRLQIRQIYAHPIQIQIFNVLQVIFVTIFWTKMMKEFIQKHLRLESVHLVLLILPIIAKITIS